MNIRLSGNSIRFRISQAEYDDLKAGQPVLAKTDLPEGQSLSYSVRLLPPEESNMLEDISLGYAENVLELKLSSTALKKLGDPPSKDGLTVETTLKNGETLRYALQVDLGKRRG